MKFTPQVKNLLLLSNKIFFVLFLVSQHDTSLESCVSDLFLSFLAPLSNVIYSFIVMSISNITFTSAAPCAWLKFMILYILNFLSMLFHLTHKIFLLIGLNFFFVYLSVNFLKSIILNKNYLVNWKFVLTKVKVTDFRSD